MSKWTKSATSLAVAAVIFGSVTMAQAADTFKIAVAGPVTGAVAQYGDMQFRGVDVAVDMLNKIGGIDGKMIEAVVYDDACEPKQAVAVANKIINDGIQYVVGHLCSGATMPASDVYEDEGILMVTPAATSPEITTRGYEFIFRTTGLDSDQAPTAADYITDVIKPKNVAIIHDKQQYGEGLASTVKKELEAAGVNIVSYEGVTAGDKDFSALIAKLQKEDIDFVYYGGYHPELGLILRQAAERGLDIKFMGPEGVGNPDITSIAGAASEGLLVTMLSKYHLDPANAPIVEALEAKGESVAGPFTWTAYAAMQSIREAVNTVGDDPSKVADFLRAESVDTVMGPLHWDDKGDLKGFSFGVFTWHADGTSSPVK